MVNFKIGPQLTGLFYGSETMSYFPLEAIHNLTSSIGSEGSGICDQLLIYSASIIEYRHNLPVWQPQDTMSIL